MKKQFRKAVAWLIAMLTQLIQPFSEDEVEARLREAMAEWLRLREWVRIHGMWQNQRRQLTDYTMRDAYLEATVVDDSLLEELLARKLISLGWRWNPDVGYWYKSIPPKKCNAKTSERIVWNDVRYPNSIGALYYEDTQSARSETGLALGV